MYLIKFSDGNEIIRNIPAPVGQIWFDCEGNEVTVISCNVE